MMFKTAGHDFGNWLQFEPRQTSCGDISDGVGFSHAICENPQNKHQITPGWVLSFADLEAMYFAAKKERTVQSAASEPEVRNG